MGDPIKYPRTFHLPFSPGISSDDKVISEETLARWEGREVVVTEKRDGENTTLTRDGCHARSASFSMGHPSQSKVRALWGSIAHEIPENYRICGESLAAKHSIKYTGLKSCFEVFSVWEPWEQVIPVEDAPGGWCWDWDPTVELAQLIGLQTVPVLWRGSFNRQFMEKFHERLDLTRQEGYVIRPAAGFDFRDFSSSLAKWVRKDHISTDVHWRENWEWNEITGE